MAEFRGIKLPEKEINLLKELEKLTGKKSIFSFHEQISDLKPMEIVVRDNHINQLGLKRCEIERLPDSVVDLIEMKNIDLRDNDVLDLPKLLKDNVFDTGYSFAYGKARIFVEIIMYTKISTKSQKTLRIVLSDNPTTVKSFYNLFIFNRGWELAVISDKIIEHLGVDELFSYIDSKDRILLTNVLPSIHELYEKRYSFIRKEIFFENYVERSLGNTNRELFIQILLRGFDSMQSGRSTQDFFFKNVVKMIGFYYVDYLIKNVFTQQIKIDKSIFQVLDIIISELNNQKIKENVEHILKSKIKTINIFYDDIAPREFVRIMKLLLVFIDFSEFLKILDFNKNKMDFIMKKITERIDDTIQFDNEGNLELPKEPDWFEAEFKVLENIDNYFIDYMAKRLIKDTRQLDESVIHGCIKVFNYLKKGVKISENFYVSLKQKGLYIGENEEHRLKREIEENYRHLSEKERKERFLIAWEGFYDKMGSYLWIIWHPPIINIYKNSQFVSMVELDEYYDYIYAEDESIEEGINRLKDLIDKLKLWVNKNPNSTSQPERLIDNLKTIIGLRL